METFAICSPAVKIIFPESFTQKFFFNEENIFVGLLTVPVKNIKKKEIDNKVVVRVKAFSCNYRDRMLLSLFNTRCNEIGNTDKFCYSPFGSDFVAEVIECGKQVHGLKIGDRVIPDSSYPFKKASDKLGGIPTNYASQRIHVFDENQLIKIPESMPDEIAAAFTITAQTSYSIIRKLNLKPKENILITAPSSNTSLSLIKFLQNIDVNVFALASNLLHKKELQELGVTDVLQISNFSNKTIFELTGGKYFNAVFDPFFNIYMEKVFPAIGFSGRYITCGLAPDYNELNGIKNFSELMENSIVRNISIIGNCLGTTNDLENALMDFENEKYNIIIDSVYTGNDILPFLQKSFGILPRFGKVVYKYQS